MHHIGGAIHQKEGHLLSISILRNDGWALKHKNGRLCELHEICSSHSCIVMAFYDTWDLFTNCAWRFWKKIDVQVERGKGHRNRGWGIPRSERLLGYTIVSPMFHVTYFLWHILYEGGHLDLI